MKQQRNVPANICKPYSGRLDPVDGMFHIGCSVGDTVIDLMWGPNLALMTNGLWMVKVDGQWIKHPNA